MHAILAADYSFTPAEYWRGVSSTARAFINRCLTVDPGERMTAHQALQHPWLAADGPKGEHDEAGKDLLPVVKKNFNARRTLHAAIDTIRAINKLREGGAAGMMNGALSRDPSRGAPAPAEVPGQGPARQPENQPPQHDDPAERFVGEGGDRMEIDGRSHGRGQTTEMIRAQERKVQETARGLWSKAGG
jgi:serine/threonine protein kinase